MIKQYWRKLAQSIDARTLRERVIIFVMAVLVLVTLINTTLIGPQYDEQKKLTDRIKQQASTINGMQTDIQKKMLLQSVGVDTPSKVRLRSLSEQSAQMRTALQDTQKGMIPPDRMASLLEGILKQQGKLMLVSLKSLPATNLIAPIVDAAKPADKTNDGKSGGGSIYTHGMQITVRGSYLDMMTYLAGLEASPWHLFWSKVQFNTADYPESTLTLTLYTLSLDKAWLDL
jgi:MSHA biogenesis protein MshJ